MQYEVERADDAAGEPSIAEMTEKAIKILQRNPKGYFLLVEGKHFGKQNEQNILFPSLCRSEDVLMHSQN